MEKFHNESQLSGLILFLQALHVSTAEANGLMSQLLDARGSSTRTVSMLQLLRTRCRALKGLLAMSAAVWTYMHPRHARARLRFFGLSRCVHVSMRGSVYRTGSCGMVICVSLSNDCIACRRRTTVVVECMSELRKCLCDPNPVIHFSRSLPHVDVT